MVINFNAKMFEFPKGDNYQRGIGYLIENESSSYRLGLHFPIHPYRVDMHLKYLENLGKLENREIPEVSISFSIFRAYTFNDLSDYLKNLFNTDREYPKDYDKFKISGNIIIDNQVFPFSGYWALGHIGWNTVEVDFETNSQPIMLNSGYDSKIVIQALSCESKKMS